MISGPSVLAENGGANGDEDVEDAETLLLDPDEILVSSMVLMRRTAVCCEDDVDVDVEGADADPEDVPPVVVVVEDDALV